MDKTRPPQPVTLPAVRPVIEKPQEKKPEEPIKKKRHGWLIFFIVIIIIVIGISTALAATGVYAVPVLTDAFNSDQPIDLGISSDPKHLETLYAQVPLTISGTRTNSIANMFEGEMDVNMRGTSEEITAWLKRFEGDHPVFSSVQVNMIEGGMEVSGMVNEYLQAPAYIKALVTSTSATSINLTIQDAKLGRISVPDQYLDDIEEYFEDAINDRMASVKGFSIEKLEYHDGYGDFIGTLPSSALSHDRGWSALIVE